MGPAVADGNHRTVGRRPRDQLGGDHAVRAGTVVHDDRLPQSFIELLCDQPRDDVLSGAGGGRDDQPDRLVWEASLRHDQLRQ